MSVDKRLYRVTLNTELTTKITWADRWYINKLTYQEHYNISLWSGTGDAVITWTLIKHLISTLPTDYITINYIRGDSGAEVTSEERIYLVEELYPGDTFSYPVLRSVICGGDGETKENAIFSNTAWLCSPIPSWGQMTPSSGTTDAIIMMNVSKNSTGSPREQQITLVSNALHKWDWMLYSLGRSSEDIFTVTPTSLTFEPAGGTKTLTVDTIDTNYTVEWESTTGFYHEGSNYPSNPGIPVISADKTTVSITMPETLYSAIGKGNLLFKNSQGVTVKVVNITQASLDATGTSPILSFSASRNGSYELSIGSNAKSYSISFDPNKLLPDWVTVETTILKIPIDSSWRSTAVIKGTITENTLLISRRISMAESPWMINYNGDNNGSGAGIQIFQAAAPPPPPYLTVTPDPLVFPATGGTLELTVDTNDSDYTVAWESTTGFFHEGANYPSNPGLPIKSGNKVSITMPETLIAVASDSFLGKGVLIFYYADHTEATRVTIKLSDVDWLIDNTLTFLSTDSGPFRIKREYYSNNLINWQGTPGVDPSWVSIDRTTTLESIPNSYVLYYYYTGTILLNETTQQRTYNTSDTLGALGVAWTSVRIIQKEATPYFNVTPSSVIFEPLGGEVIVTVDTNIPDFTVGLSSELYHIFGEQSVTWGTIEQLSKTTFKISCIDNTQCAYTFNNSSAIVFTALGVSYFVSVTLKPGKPNAWWDPVGPKLISNKGGESWSTTFYENNIGNLEETYNIVYHTFTKNRILGYPNNRIIYNITSAPNTTTEPNYSFIFYTDRSGQYPRLYPTYKFTLDIGEYVFNFNGIDTLTFSDVGSTTSVTQNYNFSWELLYSNYPSWIHITDYSDTGLDITPEGVKYTGVWLRSSTFNVTVDTNTGPPRSYKIPYNTSRGIQYLEIILEQTPSITVSPSTLNVDSYGKLDLVIVTSTKPWSVVGEIPNWVILGATIGIAGETVVVITTNSTLNSRIGTVTFKIDGREYYAVLTVNLTGETIDYDITDIEDGSDWSDRKETRIRDKYMKVRVRYTGNEPVKITGIKTLYTISHA